MGAIKSVGFEAISNIVNERKKNGNFKSLNNFISRVNPKDVNKLQLEGLVKAGAFDKLDENSNKFLTSIPKIIQKIKNNYDEKNSNQKNLFESLEDVENENFEFEDSTSWSKKDLLFEEFKSLGFYISDHPLNEFDSIFSQLKIISYKDFINSNLNESLVAGTIMSIQEKKSSKGNPFAIVKFSDKSGEYELFLFSDMLTTNREILKESSSFVLTLQKDRASNDKNIKRVNLRKILDLSEIVNKPYEKVSIELSENYNMKELQEVLSQEGKTQINLIINNKKLAFKLEKNRKFDLKTFNYVKSMQYVRKISF